MSFALTSNFFSHARGIAFVDGGGITWAFNASTNQITANGSGAGPTGANPTAKVGLSAINGSAGTFMRSDGSPPIDQAIIPTWTGLHTFSAGVTVSAGTVTIGAFTLALAGNATISGTNTGDQTIPAGANPSASVGLSAVNGSASTFMRSDGAPALSQAIIPTWTGLHTFSAGITVSAGTVTIGAFTLALAGNATISGTNTGDQTLPTGANPSASTGLSAVNGSASTFMRSDGAPALSQSIAPSWSGAHLWTGSPSYSTSVTQISIGKLTGGGPAIAWSQAGGAVDTKLWDNYADSTGVMHFRVVNDAQNASTDWLTATRTGVASIAVAIPHGALTVSGGLGVNGASAAAQSTGWGTPANGAVVASYNATTEGGTNTTKAVAQILTVLKSLGVLGA